MNYEKIYWNLITKAIGRKARGELPKGLRAVDWNIHHIIPKFNGGSDADWNMIALTMKEHLLAHMLIGKVWPNAKNGQTKNINHTIKKIKAKNLSQNYRAQAKVIIKKYPKEFETFGHIIGNKEKTTKTKKCELIAYLMQHKNILAMLENC